MKLTLLQIVVYTVGLIGAQPLYAEETDITAELKRLRKELMSVQEERNRIQEDGEKDNKAFSVYRKRTLEKRRSIIKETDSLRQIIEVQKMQKDSLQAALTAQKSRKKEYELKQDAFRQRMITLCDSMKTHQNNLPPSVMSKSLSALTLLQNELATKSVDNVEAITRFFQIARDTDGLSRTMQVVQGSSPVPEISGMTYCIRIGTLFEAVVNAKGTQAALWTGIGENNVPQWEMLKDAMVAGQIFSAVNIREGKSLPALVSLPWHHREIIMKGEEQNNE